MNRCAAPLVALFAAQFAALALAGAVRADSITLRGSSIAQRNCAVQGVEAGQVHYLDASSRRHARPADEITAIDFDALPSLGAAEALLAGGDADLGLLRLLQAALEATEPMHRLWTHLRLARLHDERGEFTAAARHAAEVWMLDDDLAWQGAAPTSEPSVAPGGAIGRAAALEAAAVLARAERRIESPILVERIRRLREGVDVVRAAVAPDVRRVDPDATISGYRREAILGGGAEPTANGDRDDTAAPRASRTAPPPAPPRTNPRTNPRSTPAPAVSDADGPLASIDALLAAGRAEEAVAHCRALAERPPSPLPSFLLRYGRALRAAGAPRDAAVVLLEAAINHPGHRDAPEALLEAALAVRDGFADTDAARRLLEEAIRAAEALERAPIAERARSALAGLESPP